jgi:hypothetical protein
LQPNDLLGRRDIVPGYEIKLQAPELHFLFRWLLSFVIEKLYALMSTLLAIIPETGCFIRVPGYGLLRDRVWMLPLCKMVVFFE